MICFNFRLDKALIILLVKWLLQQRVKFKLFGISLLFFELELLTLLSRDESALLQRDGLFAKAGLFVLELLELPKQLFLEKVGFLENSLFDIQVLLETGHSISSLFHREFDRLLFIDERGQIEAFILERLN